MKKVRYAIGAIGVAPALGLMVPAASAAAAVTHAPQKADKTVSLQHRGMVHTCKGTPGTVISAASNGLRAFLTYRHKCMFEVSDYLAFSSSPEPLHSMRTRAYSARGAIVFSGRVFSETFSGNVAFFQRIGMKADRACESVFLASSPGRVVYGPVCETI